MKDNYLNVREEILYNSDYQLDESVKDLFDKVMRLIDRINKCDIPENIPRSEIEAIKGGSADEKQKNIFKEWINKTWKKNKKFFYSIPEDVLYVMAIFPEMNKLLDTASIQGIARQAAIPFLLCVAFKVKSMTKEKIMRRVRKYIEMKNLNLGE